MNKFLWIFLSITLLGTSCYRSANLDVNESTKPSPSVVLKINAYVPDTKNPGQLISMDAEHLEVFLVQLLKAHGFTRSPELAKHLEVYLGNEVRAQKKLRFSELTPTIQ